MLPNQPQLLLQQQKQKRVPTQPTFNVDDDSGNKICEIFSSSFESDENVVADVVFLWINLEWEAILFLNLNRPGAEPWLFQNNDHLGCWRRQSTRRQKKRCQSTSDVCKRVIVSVVKKAVGNDGVSLSAPTTIKTACKKYPQGQSFVFLGVNGSRCSVHFDTLLGRTTEVQNKKRVGTIFGDLNKICLPSNAASICPDFY